MRVFDAAQLSNAEFGEILLCLRSGGVVGFPTDTAYGLAANPFDPGAVEEIFRIKGRPEDKPILLLVDSMAMAHSLTHIAPAAAAVCGRFWPGPLTVVLPARSHVPHAITAGSGSVGLRLPEAPFAQRLMGALQGPVTATSANLAGRPTAVTAEEVREQLDGRLEILIDGGTLPERGGSTVFDMTAEPPRVLREGPVPRAALEAVLLGRLA